MAVIRADTMAARWLASLLYQNRAHNISHSPSLSCSHSLFAPPNNSYAARLKFDNFKFWDFCFISR